MAHKTAVMVSSTFRSIGVMTIVTSMLWTAYGVYSALNKPSDIQIPAAILQPVTPSIDMQTIEELQNRRQITSEVTNDAVVQQALAILLIEPTTPPTESPLVTAEPETQVASQSAETIIEEPSL